MLTPIIDELSFALDAGQLAVVTGSTGSGKTTLARLIAGELAPSSGSIERDDQVWWTPMGGVGLPQASTLLELGADVDGAAASDSRERRPVRQLASELGIRDHDLERPIGELSYGNRQKALAALAFARRGRRLVIVDEPFAGVDQASLRPMADLIQRARRSGTAVVMINSVEVPDPTPDLIIDLER